MSFEEAIKYLYSLGNETLAMKLGLESVRALARALDDPQRKFPAIHIAGTNGKGSTSAMTASVLRAAGLRAGLYTSPHLVSITERIRIGADEIAPDEFARLANEARAAGERLVAENALPAPPTFFEQITMIAYLYFAERKVDLAVLEVGLGGRLDATNICEPIVTAITRIGFDHQKYLGDTLASIAAEKAGIVKPDAPVVIAPQLPEAMNAIAARCKEMNTPMILTSEPFDIEAASGGENIGRYRFRYRTSSDEYALRLGLRGRHQITNAIVAIHIAEQLRIAGFDIPHAAIVEGLNNAEWPGRLEMIRLSPSQAPLLLDGAHNADSARALRDFLDEHFRSTPITILFGAMADKAISEMSDILFPAANQVIVTSIDSPRAAEPGAIAEASHRDVIRMENAGEALDEALRITPPDGLIVVCGSLFLIGEIRQSVPNNKQSDGDHVIISRQRKMERQRRFMNLTSPVQDISTLYPESDGKPMAETDIHRQLLSDLVFTLDNFFHAQPDVYVSGNLLIYYVEGNPKKRIAPDIFVARGVKKGQRRIYKLWEEGVAPQIVIELTSRQTWREDLQEKWRLYEQLGVEEYFIFDPEYDYLDDPLVGYRLKDGKYKAMNAHDGRLRSKVLGLELVDTGETLRLFDPNSGRFLPNWQELTEELARYRERFGVIEK